MGNVTVSRLGNGVQTTRTFDAASGHILGISSATASGAAIQSLDYRFDVLGNLMERRDGLQQLKETIGYDTLNRMVSVNTTLPGTNGAQSTAKTVTYDARGNIRWRSDVGTYHYEGVGNVGCAANGGLAACPGERTARRPGWPADTRSAPSPTRACPAASTRNIATT